MRLQCRLTAPISDRTLTVQHAGETDLFEHNPYSPAAEQFMCPGSLHGFVGRQAAHPNFNFFLSSAQSRRYRLIRF
jgi:hypothetical protein